MLLQTRNKFFYQHQKKLTIVSDIYNWMKSEKIERHFEAFQKHEIDGKALLELKFLLNSPQQQFSNFQALCEKMGIEKVGEILKLSSAIRKL